MFRILLQLGTENTASTAAASPLTLQQQYSGTFLPDVRRTPHHRHLHGRTDYDTHLICCLLVTVRKLPFLSTAALYVVCRVDNHRLCNCCSFWFRWCTVSPSARMHGKHKMVPGTAAVRHSSLFLQKQHHVSVKQYKRIIMKQKDDSSIMCSDIPGIYTLR